MYEKLPLYGRGEQMDYSINNVSHVFPVPISLESRA